MSFRIRAGQGDFGGLCSCSELAVDRLEVRVEARVWVGGGVIDMRGGINSLALTDPQGLGR